MDYQDSNRKKLKDALDKIFVEKRLNMRELSLAVGRSEDYFSCATNESVFNSVGDISDKKIGSIMAQLGDKNLIFRLSYEKSRCFKLKQHTALAAKELNISEGEISLLVSSSLNGVRASANYLSNKMTQSCFHMRGDIDAGELSLLILTIGKVVTQRKESELSTPMSGRKEALEMPLGSMLVYKRTPKRIVKKPTLLNPEQIAEKLKQLMGYSSAMWVDGHLVLSDESIKSAGEAL